MSGRTASLGMVCYICLTWIDYMVVINEPLHNICTCMHVMRIMRSWSDVANDLLGFGVRVWHICLHVHAHERKGSAHIQRVYIYVYMYMWIALTCLKMFSLSIMEALFPKHSWYFNTTWQHYRSSNETIVITMARPINASTFRTPASSATGQPKKCIYMLQLRSRVGTTCRPC